MFLNFKQFVVLLVLSIYFPINAQNDPQTEEPQTIERHLGMFSVGAYWLNPIGDNFTKDGLDLSTGFDINLQAYILPRITLGLRYNFVSADVENIQITGNYDESNIWVLGGSLGYEFRPINQLSILVLAGAGSAVYRNRRQSIRFTDRGIAFWLAPEIGYSFTQYIALYIKPEYRYDHMNIDVPNALENSFNKINYISVGAGLRVWL